MGLAQRDWPNTQDGPMLHAKIGIWHAADFRRWISTSNGVVSREGPTADLRDDPAIRSAYLGF
jgi:hypothetical protein